MAFAFDDKPKPIRREFKGKVNTQGLSKEAAGYEKAHLKAYLKGKQIFKYGERPIVIEYPDGRTEIVGYEPIWHTVK